VEQKKRLKILNDFKNGELPILVATDVASRGLHIEGVTHVVNWDMPQDPEDYVHRIGRTARAGATGKSISLADETGALQIEPIEKFIGEKIPVEWAEDELLLPELVRFIRERKAFAIVAPRKPERFELVAALLAAASLRVLRRSELSGVETPSPAIDVLLLDSVGELAAIYPFATVAFIGGSLVPTGGHNPIEAAAAGVPVCFGPHMSNFREIAAVFLRGGGAVEVRNARDVFSLAERLLDDKASQASMGERARRTVQENRGASERTARRIVDLLGSV